MHHDTRIGQSDAHAWFARRKEETAHGRRLPDAYGADFRTDILHRVVDRHARSDHTTRRVDIHPDVFLRIVRFEKQQLRGNDGGHIVLHFARHENDPFAQKPRKNVPAALPTVRLLDNDGDQCLNGIKRNVHEIPLKCYVYALAPTSAWASKVSSTKTV